MKRKGLGNEGYIQCNEVSIITLWPVKAKFYCIPTLSRYLELQEKGLDNFFVSHVGGESQRSVL